MPSHRRPNPRTSPRPTGDRRRLTLAMIVSLLAHATAATLLLAYSPTDPSTQRPRISLAEVPSPPPPAPERVRLGAQDSQITSITWIGFDEYKPHIADQSSVDQPDLTQAEPAGEPSPLTAESPQQPTAHSSNAAAATSQPDTTPAEPSPRVVTQSPSPLGDNDPLSQSAEGEPGIAPLLGPPPPTPPEPKSESGETPASAPEPDPETLSPAQSPLKTPSPPPQPASGNPSEATGRQSDRESDPSSIITATVKELGQPLVAHGLEMKTVRPRFTYYTQLTAAPKNPTIRLFFDSAGKVQKAQIMQSSGFQDVDRPILDAMYQWRATGEQLKHIPAGTSHKKEVSGAVSPGSKGDPSAPPATLAVDIRLILSQ